MLGEASTTAKPDKVFVFMSYLEKLKDPRWQKKRLEIFSRDEFTCKYCGDSDSSLQVHHIWYQSNNPWETQNELLVTLCESCHEEEEERLKELKLNLLNDLRKAGMVSLDIEYLSMIFYNNRPFGSRTMILSILMELMSEKDFHDKVLRLYKDHMNTKPCPF